MQKFFLPIVCSVMITGCHHGSADIVLTPDAIENCGDATLPTTITVHWDASKADPKASVTLWVSNRPVPAHAGVFDPPFGSIWLSTNATGTATTGPWVMPGMTITITDVRERYVLRQIRIPSRPCTQRENLKHEQPR